MNSLSSKMPSHLQDDDPSNNEPASRHARVVIALVAVLIGSIIAMGGFLILVVAPRQLSSEELSTRTGAITNINDMYDKAYPVVDTGQQACYDDHIEVTCPGEGQAYAGQDAHYSGHQPSYRDNGDGTITDAVTGLIWQRDVQDKMSYADAVSAAREVRLGGYTDWRIPTIKELYSLMNFSGVDPGQDATMNALSKPFINTEYFAFRYGKATPTEYINDSQWISTTTYRSTVMGSQACFFGVNFADGRIQCYPKVQNRPGGSGYFVRYVRGNNVYGHNSYVRNGDVVHDRATGLYWQREDSSGGLSWSGALDYCNTLTLSHRTDWRLPNAKELQSIVDYTRSPDTTNTAAIDALFIPSVIKNEATHDDYPSYWSSTTHLGRTNAGREAVYISFGRAMGNMPEYGGWLDVHGAGAQRSDPKSGMSSEYATGRSPQGDAVRSMHYVRCVAG